MLINFSLVFLLYISGFIYPYRKLLVFSTHVICNISRIVCMLEVRAPQCVIRVIRDEVSYAMIGDVLEISALTLVHYGAYARGLSARVVFSSRSASRNKHRFSLFSWCFSPGIFISKYFMRPLDPE